VKLPRAEEIDAKIENAGLEAPTYTRWGAYLLSLQHDDITRHRDLLRELMKAAYDSRAL
jgi:hypothetical protein